MRVKIIATGIWKSLNGVEVEVLDAWQETWVVMVRVPVVGRELSPPLPKDTLDLMLYQPPRNPGQACRICGEVHVNMQSAECVAAGPDGPVVVTVTGDPYEEFIVPKRRAAADAEATVLNRVATR